MKKFTAVSKSLITVLVAVLFLTACNARPSVVSSSMEQGNVLRVAMECGYAPFNWTQQDDSNGAVKIQGENTYAGGYDVEIAKRIAEKLGKELVIIKSEWDGLVPTLTSGKADLIIAGMSDTAERRETIDFTESYYTSDLVIVVTKAGAYAGATSLKDFAGAKVTGQLNTLHYGVIDQIEGVDKRPAAADFPIMLVSLAAGKIDGFVSERPGAFSAVATNPGLTYIAFEDGKGFDYETGDVSIAAGVEKGNPLRDEVNTVLASITEEDRIAIMEQAVQSQPMAA